jgi:PmbA protein
VTPDDLLNRAAEIAAMAGRAGADAAEAYLGTSREIEIKIIRGRVERTMESEDMGCGLRISKGLRQGFASTTDLSREGLCALVDGALAVAARVPEDPYAALPEPPGRPYPTLSLLDPGIEELSWERAADLATRTESAALAVDPRLVSGEGSFFAAASGKVALASTLGVAAAYGGTHASLGCSPLAVHRGERQRQSWHEARRFLADLPAPETVGRCAGERAVRMLGARPLPKGSAPVVFDPIEGARLWGGLTPAFVGDSVRRGISFLSRDLDRVIASPGVSLIEDSTVDRAPGSRPFDGEGWPTSRRPLIENGVLRGFLYDSRSARRAGTKTTGHALRGYSSRPSPGAHAVHLAAGRHTPEEILRAAGRGLYVTHLIGFGLNLVTGDYSRGANGWWFENGEYAFPVHEVTLSGNLRDLLRGVPMIGNDLIHRASSSSPTFLVEGFVISGPGAKS